MELRLLSHVNGDGDLLEAWLKYYRRLGITSFHLVVHGPREDNVRLFALKDSYPVVIEDSYEAPFDSEEKKRRLNSLLTNMREQWLVIVDSDEFVEFPYRNIPITIRMLKLARANALFAPMLQHLAIDGSLDTPAVIEDPFRTLPLCSFELYQKMGVKASIDKYPLFYSGDKTLLSEGGNHHPPMGSDTRLSSLRGVTHHFKFRRSVSQRLENRVHSSHPWRHESVQFQQYLEKNSNRLPTDGAFTYSRETMFRRGFLQKFTLRTIFKRFIGR